MRSSLSLQDTAFIEEIERDITYFITNTNNRRVLVFPPVTNYRRFLIHRIVEESFPNLKTFSVGEGDDRRTVVCFLSDYNPDTPVCGAAATCAPVAGNRLARKRARIMPSLGIYRPPAARKLENGQDLSCQSRHPVETPPPCDDQIKVVQVSPPPCAKLSSDNILVNRKSGNRKEKQKRPDMAVYVPRGQRIAQEHQRKLEATLKDHGVELRLENSVFEHLDSSDTEQQQNLTVQDIESYVNNCNERNSEGTDETQHPSDDIYFKKDISGLNKINLETEAAPLCRSPSIENVHKSSETNKNVDDDCNQFINESKITPPNDNGGGDEPRDLSNNDDWDVLYDDSGECLDPTIVSQLTNAVGKVAIEKPKSSYQEYTHRSIDEEFPHIVEMYNFPPEFKTPDLFMIFSDYKNLGFEIKWVDDTHALGVFSNAAVVAEVLRLQHPLVKTRSLSEGSPQSKNKARRCADSLTPYTTRPDTCAALARRLVTGALGVKLPTQRAEREAERRILQQAREKKRLAAKQREEAWEGNFS